MQYYSKYDFIAIAVVNIEAIITFQQISSKFFLNGFKVLDFFDSSEELLRFYLPFIKGTDTVLSVSQFRLFGHLLMIRDYTLFIVITVVIFNSHHIISRIFDVIRSFYW